VTQRSPLSPEGERVRERGRTRHHNNLFAEPGWEALLSTLERFAFSHFVHRVVPFVGELMPELSLPHRNVICFGWSPGVFDRVEFGPSPSPSPPRGRGDFRNTTGRQGNSPPARRFFSD